MLSVLPCPTKLASARIPLESAESKHFSIASIEIQKLWNSPILRFKIFWEIFFQNVDYLELLLHLLQIRKLKTASVHERTILSDLIEDFLGNLHLFCGVANCKKVINVLMVRRFSPFHDAKKPTRKWLCYIVITDWYTICYNNVQVNIWSHFSLILVAE